MTVTCGNAAKSLSFAKRYANDRYANDRYANDRVAYTEAKTPIIRHIEQLPGGLV